MKIRKFIVRQINLILIHFYDWKDIKVTIVLGTGRTGTEFFAKLLKQLYRHEILAIHEPSPDLLKISVESRLHGWSALRIAREIKISRIKYLKKCKNANLRYYIESNNNLSFLIPYLSLVFPNLKIIYFTRDPETFLLSELNKRHGTRKFLLFDSDDKRQRITPDLLDSSINNWEMWSRPKKIIWYWAACNKFIIDHIGTLNFKLVQYEDFFSKEKEMEVLREILSYIGLDLSDKLKEEARQMLKIKINSSKDRGVKSLADLSEDERIFYNKTITGLAAQLYYTHKP